MYGYMGLVGCIWIWFVLHCTVTTGRTSLFFLLATFFFFLICCWCWWLCSFTCMCMYPFDLVIKKEKMNNTSPWSPAKYISFTFTESPLQLQWTQWGPHLLSSLTNSVMLSFYCPFSILTSAVAASNMITALLLVLRLAFSLFSISLSVFLALFLILFPLRRSIDQCCSPLVYLLMLIASVMHWKCPGWPFRANSCALCCCRAQTNWTGESGWSLCSVGE